MMDKFTVIEREAGKPCFVLVEGRNIAIELREPADVGHAQTVALYLHANVSHITSLANDLDSPFESKSAVAIAINCLVRTISEQDPSFDERFLQSLSEDYYVAREPGAPGGLAAMELLRWVRDLTKKRIEG